MFDKTISQKLSFNNTIRIAALSLSSIFIASTVSADQNKGTIYSPPAPEKADHKFRMNVAIANDSYSDPIKFLNTSKNAHHHLFVGNGNIDNNTTNAPNTTGSHSLRFDTKPINFMEGNGANRSAYWTPIMYNHGPDGKIGSESAQADDFPMVMGFNQIYYTKGNDLSDVAWEASIKPMPEGLKIISSTNEYVFNCGFRDESDSNYFIPVNGGTDNNWPDGFWPPNRGASIPKCDTSLANNVTMKITFPDCWDGVNLTDKDDDTNPLTTSPKNNHDHMAYSNWKTGCPSSHPVQLGTVQYNFYFPIKSVNDDTSKYYLSSDVNMMDGYSIKCEDGKNGCTNHGDWMNGWEPSLMNKMVNTTDGCLGSKIDHCANGKLDHDETLEDSISGNTASDFQRISFNYKFKHNKPIVKEHDQMDTEAPSKPEKPKISDITQTSIKINWKASSDNVGVSAYEVNYNGKIKTVSGTGTTLSGLTPNVNYSIKVRAKDAAGNTSAFSNPETAVTNADTSTAPVLVANAGSNKLLRCGDAYRTLAKPNGKTPTSDGATYLWTTSNGQIVGASNAKTVRGSKAGTYKLTVSKKGSQSVSDTAAIIQEKGCVTIPVIYTLSYQAEKGGKIFGETSQKINHGKSGASVTAVANKGYTFVKWSDGLKTAKRTDKASSNVSFTAKFSKNKVVEPPVTGKPKATTLIGPTGNTTDTTPSYSWNAVSGATWYYLWSRDNQGDISNKWYHKSKLNCESGTCSTTPSTELPLGSVRWYVISWNKSGLSPWSKGMRFNVTDPTNPTAIVSDSPENLSEKAPTMPGAPEEATTDSLATSDDKASGGSFGFLLLPLALMGLRRRVATLKTKV